jgi:hypothetical protein
MANLFESSVSSTDISLGPWGKLSTRLPFCLLSISHGKNEFLRWRKTRNISRKTKTTQKTCFTEIYKISTLTLTRCRWFEITAKKQTCYSLLTVDYLKTKLTVYWDFFFQIEEYAKMVVPEEKFPERFELLASIRIHFSNLYAILLVINLLRTSCDDSFGRCA